MAGFTLMILYFNHCLINTCCHYLKAEFSKESWKPMILKNWNVLLNQLFWWIYLLSLVSFVFWLVASFCQCWLFCLKGMDLNSWKKISIALKRCLGSLANSFYQIMYLLLNSAKKCFRISQSFTFFGTNKIDFLFTLFFSFRLNKVLTNNNSSVTSKN